MRSLSAELNPPILGTGSLRRSLEWLARWMNGKHGLAVKVALESVAPVPDETVTLLFRCIRELLFNVVKHAGTKMATVRVQQLDNRILVEVEDQGIGFDPATLDISHDTFRGIGLIGIRERLNYSGGSMEIDSEPGRGSRFRLLSPPLYSSDEIRSDPAMPAGPPLRQIR
jgi:signal transduction histidine kinase